MHLKPQMPSSLLTKVLRREKDHERNYQGGSRCVTESFNWETVKDISYKNRDCYLGYTAKIGYLDKAGKWKKNDWYKSVNRPEGSVDQKRKEEIKKQEQEAMDVALGLKRADLEDVKLSKLNKNQAQIFNKRIKESTGDSKPETLGLGYKTAETQIKSQKQFDLSKNKFKLEGTQTKN